MAALCIFLTAACGYDYRDKRIPNSLIIWMAAVGTGWRFWGESSSGVLFYLGQMVFMMIILYPFFRIGGLGAGDVKLFGVTAGYLPAEKILTFLVCSLLIAVVISVVKMRNRECFWERAACLTDYLSEVMKSGRWRLYPAGKGCRTSRVCMAGPVFVSVLLYLGGVY